MLAREAFPHVVDSSMLTTFKACRQQGFRRYMQHLRAGRSIDLIAGGAFAKGLETTRRLYYHPEIKMPLQDALANGAVALLKSYGDPEIPEDTPKTPERMTLALLEFFKKWPPGTDLITPTILDGGEPAVEFSFAIPLPIPHPETGDDIIFAGRFDMLADYQRSLFIEDDKTTKGIGKTWATQWDMRGQFTGYVWAMHQLGYPVAGCIIRGTAILKTLNHFAETITDRPKWMLERWYQGTLRLLKEMVEDWERYMDSGNSNQFQLNEGDACDHWGGCSYKKLCRARHPSDIIPDYQRNIWHPETGENESIYEPKTEVPQMEDVW